jgi:hypothetical protein
MKIIDCRLRHLTSLARSLKVTWRVKLDDNRIVKVIDYRNWEDDIVDGWVEGIEFHERDLLDSLIKLTESADYTYYEI